jgi:hypothetical protein
MSFEPNFTTLPKIQRKIWSYFQDMPKDFVLYGGTAIALRFGHRQSVDFDFFTSRQDIDLKEIARSLSLVNMFPHEVILDSENQFDFLIFIEGEGVKITLLNNRKIIAGSVAAPDVAKDNNVNVASPLDLMACKVLALHRRSEPKDFFDIVEMIKNGISLQKGFEAAYAISKISPYGSEQLMLERLAEDFKAKSTEITLFECHDKTISSKAHEYATILKIAATHLDIDKITHTQILASVQIESSPIKPSRRAKCR